MLEGTRIPLNADEHAAAEKLIGKHGGGSLTRRDPGDSGPVIFENPAGDAWEIAEDGKTKKQRRRA